MLNTYAARLRHELHQCPEIGFDLDRTLAVIRRELCDMGVSFTEEYGKSSIVATIHPELADRFTIGIRADIDALPITERNEVPYKSKIEGQMHACGHDAHCAILLATVKQLNERRDEIRCCVKCIFQAAEEYAPSGAKLMAEDGVMDTVDCVVALHCSPGVEVGTVRLCPGAQNAISHGFLLEFFGKSAHAANQEYGNDAIMMAVRAYTDMEFMIAKEIAAKNPIILNVGAIHGGETNNVVCDYCSLFCTVRSENETTDEYVIRRICDIGESIAKQTGGEFRYTEKKYYPIVFNDPTVTERMRSACEKVVGADRIFPHNRSMGGEDFSYFTMRKPGMMLRLGTSNDSPKTRFGLHQDRFDIDENALDIGVRVFLQFVLDNMDGISFPEKTAKTV